MASDELSVIEVRNSTSIGAVHMGVLDPRNEGIARARYSRAGKTKKNGCGLEAVINIPDFLV